MNRPNRETKSAGAGAGAGARASGLALAVALASLAATPARAELIVSLSNNTITLGPSSTVYSFEVDLTYNATAQSDPASLAIGGFQFQFSADPAADDGLTFQDVSTGTTNFGYIFGGTTSSNGPDITDYSNSSTTTISAEDAFYGQAGGVSLSSGTTVGLGEVSFTLGSITWPDITLTFGTDYSGANGPDGTLYSLIAPPPTDLSIALMPAIIPEPRSIALIAIGLAFGVGIRAHARVRRGWGSKMN